VVDRLADPHRAWMRLGQGSPAETGECVGCGMWYAKEREGCEGRASEKQEREISEESFSKRPLDLLATANMQRIHARSRGGTGKRKGC
jgi:hypothetical protein